MKPKVLILDEPTAGLDPESHNGILQMIKTIHEKENNIIILVSHNMEDVATLADKVAVMDKGRVVLTGTPTEVYCQSDTVEKVGLDYPPVMLLVRELRARGLELDCNILSIDEAEKAILTCLRGK